MRSTKIIPLGLVLKQAHSRALISDLGCFRGLSQSRLAAGNKFRRLRRLTPNARRSAGLGSTQARFKKSSLVLSLVLLTTSFCKPSNQIPEPESFGPLEEEANKIDPRLIVFHNLSVEMANLEVFAPASPLKECQKEAPHRLLCPEEYHSIFNKAVYPRKKVSVKYPEKMPLECAQVWIRVHSKAMNWNEYRESIFLLSSETGALSVELEDSPAALMKTPPNIRMNRFPPPQKYCNPLTPQTTEAPQEMERSSEEIKHVLSAARNDFKACCAKAACHGTLQATLNLSREGQITRYAVKSKRGKIPEECLLKALATLRFSGFTPKPTTAEIALQLPIRP